MNNDLHLITYSYASSLIISTVPTLNTEVPPTSMSGSGFVPPLYITSVPQRFLTTSPSPQNLTTVEGNVKIAELIPDGKSSPSVITPVIPSGVQLVSFRQTKPTMSTSNVSFSTSTTPACTWWNRPEEDNSSGKLESTHPSRTSVKSDQVFFGVESVMRVNADSLLIRAAATSTSGTLNDLTTDLIMANNTNNSTSTMTPIPLNIAESENFVDGKYQCSLCDRSFAKPHQLVMHKNIHFVSNKTVWGGDQCANKSAVTISVGNNNSRPFRCEHCNVGFTLSGHLMKHFRAQTHFKSLENLGLIPKNSYEVLVNKLQNLDVKSDLLCLESIQRIIHYGNQN